MIKKFQVLFLLIFVASCSGYRFQGKSNPFAQYSIRSISVPMFYNKSNLGNVSGVFTQEIFRTLTDFKDLKINIGKKKSDAVLIGIIDSSAKRKDSILTETSRSVKSNFGSDVIGDKRDDFVVPSANRVNMNLRIIVIKHPTEEEIKFLQTNIGKNAISSKIIFNEEMSLANSYLLKKYSGEPIKVIGSQNDGLYRESIKLLAKQAADNFRNMILYAF